MLYKVQSMKYLAKLILADIFVSKVGVSAKIAKKRPKGEKRHIGDAAESEAPSTSARETQRGPMGAPLVPPCSKFEAAARPSHNICAACSKFQPTGGRAPN